MLRVQGEENRGTDIQNSLRKVGEESVQECFSELAVSELKLEDREA